MFRVKKEDRKKEGRETETQRYILHDEEDRHAITFRCMESEK